MTRPTHTPPTRHTMPPARAGAASAGMVGLVAAVLAVVLVVVLLAVYGWDTSPGQTGGPDGSASTTTAPAPSEDAAGWRALGVSAEGRPIECFTAGSGARRVLVIGGIHGDETGADVARQLAEYLQVNPEAVPEGLRLDVIPSANPDGEAAGTRANANGVDLNRNFPSDNWSASLSAGDRPTTGLSGGAGPGSEPETQILLAVLAEGYDLIISLHSSGGIIDFDGPGAAAIAERMAAASGLPVSHLDYQEHVTGSLGTYGPEVLGVPVITVELDGAVLTEGLREAILTALPAEEPAGWSVTAGSVTAGSVTAGSVTAGSVTASVAEARSCRYTGCMDTRGPRPPVAPVAGMR